MAKKKQVEEPMAAKQSADQPKRKQRLIRLGAFLVFGAALLYGLYHLSDIFAPLLAALAVAYMLDPLVCRLEERGWSRKRAVMLIFAVTVFAMLAVIGGAVPFLIRDLSGSAEAISGEYDDANWNGILDEAEKATFIDRDGDAVADPGYIVALDIWMKKSPHLRQVSAWAEKNKIPERITAWAQENAREIAQHTLNFGSAGFEAVTNFMWKLTWWGMMALLFPIYLYVFLNGLGGITDKTTRLVPKIWRPKFEGIASELGATLSAFFRGRLVVVLAMSVFTAVAFGITGLKFGVVLGIAIGLASIVPFLNLVFLVPALLIAALEFQSPGGVILILALYAVGQLIDPILSPYLLSRGTGMHPVTVLVSLFVWGRLLGAVGLLLAVPLTAAVKILGRETVLPILADVGSEDSKGEDG